MKRSIATLVFFFSITLNLAFLGVWVARALQDSPAAENMLPVTLSPACHWQTELGLSPAQAQALQPLFDAFQKERCVICRDLDRVRGELIDALSPAEPDRDLIRRKQDEILDAQRRMQDLIVAQLLKEKELLTPEQQEAFLNVLRRCSCSAQAGGEPCGHGNGAPGR